MRRASRLCSAAATATPAGPGRRGRGRLPLLCRSMARRGRGTLQRIHPSASDRLQSRVGSSPSIFCDVSLPSRFADTFLKGLCITSGPDATAPSRASGRSGPASSGRSSIATSTRIPPSRPSPPRSPSTCAPRSRAPLHPLERGTDWWLRDQPARCSASSGTSGCGRFSVEMLSDRTPTSPPPPRSAAWAKPPGAARSSRRVQARRDRPALEILDAFSRSPDPRVRTASRPDRSDGPGPLSTTRRSGSWRRIRA